MSKKVGEENRREGEARNAEVKGKRLQEALRELRPKGKERPKEGHFEMMKEMLTPSMFVVSIID